MQDNVEMTKPMIMEDGSLLNFKCWMSWNPWNYIIYHTGQIDLVIVWDWFTLARIFFWGGLGDWPKYQVLFGMNFANWFCILTVDSWKSHKCVGLEITFDLDPYLLRSSFLLESGFLESGFLKSGLFSDVC